MFRRFLAAFAAFALVFLASTGLAFAQVDVNRADATQLQTIKGIGPAISAKIVAERKNGNFKDWADLEKRVSGIGEKNSAKFSEAGLTVGGAAKADAPMAAPAATREKTAKTMAKTGPATAPAAPAPTAMTKATTTTPAATTAKAEPAAPVSTDTKTTRASKKKAAKDETTVAGTAETPKAGKTKAKAKKGDATDATDPTTKK